MTTFALDYFYPETRAEWRAWLQDHYQSATHVWLVYAKKQSGLPRVTYSDAVDEALCFGWIDARQNPIDDRFYCQYFCPRKPRSTWSKVNKDKVERLAAAGRMTSAGFAMIEVAKANGSWTILDEVEALVVPVDLQAGFRQNPGAAAFFSGLSRTDQRNLLQWIVLAKRPETRQRRIDEIAGLAAQGLKPKQF